MSNKTHTSYNLNINEDISPVCVSAQTLSLPTNTSIIELFSPLAGKAWSMWLDSGNSEHIDSRFDILVWEPIATLTTHGDTTEIGFTQPNRGDRNTESQLSKKLTSNEDPLLILKTLQSQLFNSPLEAESIDSALPFLGGALGYFAYDLGRQFEKVPTIAEKDINLPDMAVGLYDQAIIFDKATNTFYLICDNNKRSEIEENIVNSISKRTHVQDQAPFTLTSSWQTNMNKASYIERFNQVQNYLLTGDCYQINLAQRFSSQYQGDEFEAYLALRDANKAPFAAFIRLQDSAILSVSPERFLQLSNGKVQSKPIKGTMPRSADSTQDLKNAEILKNSTKDRAENLMIVDLLRNDISRTCTAGSVKVPSLFAIESFPAVHHLVSTVEGTLSEEKHATDLLRGAFPGGSITGAPKIRAMEIIEELEPHRRSIYCGSIGYLSNCGKMDTSITIRTLICQKEGNLGTIHCWAGGGLVADSTADSEYQETFDKVNCILPILSTLNKE